MLRAAFFALAFALPLLTGCSESAASAEIVKPKLEDALVITDASKLGLTFANLRLAEPATGLSYAMMTPEEFARALANGRKLASDSCLQEAFGTSDLFELREILRSGGGGSPGSLDPEAAFAAWGVYKQCMERKGYKTSELAILSGS